MNASQQKKLAAAVALGLRPGTPEEAASAVSAIVRLLDGGRFTLAMFARLVTAVANKLGVGADAAETFVGTVSAAGAEFDAPSYAAPTADDTAADDTAADLRARARRIAAERLHQYRSGSGGSGQRPLYADPATSRQHGMTPEEWMSLSVAERQDLVHSLAGRKAHVTRGPDGAKSAADKAAYKRAQGENLGGKRAANSRARKAGKAVPYPGI